MGSPLSFCFPSGSGSGLGVAVGSVGHNGGGGLFGDGLPGVGLPGVGLPGDGPLSVGPTHSYEIIIIIIIIRLKQRYDNLLLFVLEGALDIE